MTLQQNAMSYQTTAIKNPTKKGIKLIDEMPSHRILSHLAYRHRVGLLVTTVAVLCGYIVNDKVLSIFF